MRFALNSENRRIHATAADKTQEYFCPICHGRVIPRQGEINAWHFAHQNTCTDAWSYDMSEWHRAWQERFPEEQREVVVEYNGEKHRADILTGNYVIEFQYSKISAGEFEERNAFYTSAGYKVIWVFNEVEARQTERISDGDTSDEYIWKWPNRSISSVIPQESKDVVIIFQLAEADDEINWRRCPKTGQWHNGACYRCPHNLINEHRKTGYQRYEVFCYCCYPRVINKPTESGHCYVGETCT